MKLVDLLESVESGLGSVKKAYSHSKDFETIDAIVKFISKYARDGQRVFIAEKGKPDVKIYNGVPQTPGLYIHTQLAKEKFEKSKTAFEKKVRDAVESRTESFEFTFYNSRPKSSRIGVDWVQTPDSVTIEY